MATPRLADLRNIYSAQDAEKAGFEAYEAIGRAGIAVRQKGLVAK
jgi:UDPglucose 6-dehydrogenase